MDYPNSHIGHAGLVSHYVYSEELVNLEQGWSCFIAASVNRAEVQPIVRSDVNHTFLPIASSAAFNFIELKDLFLTLGSIGTNRTINSRAAITVPVPDPEHFCFQRFDVNLKGAFVVRLILRILIVINLSTWAIPIMK